ncbi:MAG: DUF898 family protein [Rhodospirillales bacterium]|nr:MAG: DUF898 family protein [Rhodospirillales bacterium]
MGRAGTPPGQAYAIGPHAYAAEPHAGAAPPPGYAPEYAAHPPAVPPPPAYQPGQVPPPVYPGQAPPMGYYPPQGPGYPGQYPYPYGYAAPQPPPEPVPAVKLEYDGKLGELYLVYLRALLLTMLTLGVYRFWARTRVRRYLWSHFSIVGDRFEYRGRGVELFLGFLTGMGFLLLGSGLLVGGLYLFGRDNILQTVDAADVVTWTLILVGYPLLAAGQYAGMRYKLSRTRWRGIRAGMGGSAWKYAGMSIGLGFANALCMRLLTPIVDIVTTRYRVANATYGQLKFGFSGNAGDIYGRFIGFYFLNILAWMVLIGVTIAIIGGFADLIERLGGWEAIQERLAHPTPMTLIVIFLVAIALYAMIGVLILPLRCWYQAYSMRYVVSRAWHDRVYFGTGVTTWQMWGFIVFNWVILLFTLGFGWPWVLHRSAKLVASQFWIYGRIDTGAVAQAMAQGPAMGEGLLDLFDTGIV